MIFPVLLMLAQTAAPAPQPTAPAASVAKPKLICIIEDETGSRLSGKRVCRTQAEWDQLRMDLKQDMNQKQRKTAQ